MLEHGHVTNGRAGDRVLDVFFFFFFFFVFFFCFFVCLFFLIFVCNVFKATLL